MHLLYQTLQSPVLGLWYQMPDKQIFKVIAMDNDDETIEIQYFDGAIDEWDSESWYRTHIEVVAAPEDWSGPFDDLEHDDLGYEEFMILPRSHNNPIDSLE